MNVCTAEGEEAIEKGGKRFKKKKIENISARKKRFFATRERETILDLSLIREGGKRFKKKKISNIPTRKRIYRNKRERLF
jgi:hypothetical protein